MENDIILAMKNISIEVLVIAVIVFSFTMLLKLPIKKFSSKFNETKRKAINTTILILPAILSLILCILYFGIFKKEWLSNYTFEASLSAYLLSLSIYAILSRIFVLVKALISGKVKLESPELKNEIQQLENDISDLTNYLNIDQQKVKDITEKLKQLTNLKVSIENSKTFNSLISINDIDEEIGLLTEEKQSLEKEILKTKTQIEKIKN